MLFYSYTDIKTITFGGRSREFEVIEDNHKTTAVCQASSSKYPLTGVSQTHAGALVGNTIISCGGGSFPVTPSCYRQIIFINTPKRWARFKDLWM